MIGQTLSHYRIVERVGAGAMGEVYRAEDVNLGRTVAIKILPVDMAHDQERVQRFEQEAKAASALNHPNILTIHEMGQCDGLHFIVSEYIHGESLRERLERQRMGLDEGLCVAIQVSDALVAAHNAGVVHCDIKPDNIMVRDDGLVKVVDFGIAQLIDRTLSHIDCEAPTLDLNKKISPAILGTIAYMSPEHLQGKVIDARSDIWSTGVCLYEMLAGISPFLRNSLCSTLTSILQDNPPPLNGMAPSELSRIAFKALRKDRDERYQTIKDLLLDLKSLKCMLDAEGESGHSALPRSLGLPRRPKRLKQHLRVGSIILAILLAVLVVAVPWFRKREAVRQDETGRSYWKERTGDNLNQARIHFERAMALDPTNAQYPSDLADTYVLMEEYLGEPTQTTIPQAEYYNRRAIAINSSLAETHTSRAFILTKLWRWKEAEDEFKASIAINPKYAKTRQWYSLYLRIVGRYDESLKQIKIGHDIDPSDKLVRVNTVIAYLAKGESYKAVAEGEELLKLAPDFWGGRVWLGMARLGLTPVPKTDAVTDLEAGVDHSKNSHTLKGNLGFAYAVLGEPGKAEEQLKELKELYNQHKATGQDLAKIYAGLGLKDHAFEWLEKDYNIRSGDLPHISWHPAFNLLHGDPRFEDLLRRMGLAPGQSRTTVAQTSAPRREPSYHCVGRPKLPLVSVLVAGGKKQTRGKKQTSKLKGGTMGLISWLSQFVFTFEVNGSKGSVDYSKLDDQRLLITTKYPDGETIETIAHVMPTEDEHIETTLPEKAPRQASEGFALMSASL